MTETTPGAAAVRSPHPPADAEPASSAGPDPRSTWMGIAVVVLVTGAFVTGWRLGRSWGRLVGW
jgi:hypothetical protein